MATLSNLYSQVSFSACSAVGTCMILSTWSNTSLEDVAEAIGNGLRWSQLNIYKDKQFMLKYIRRVEQAGYKAIVITVDAPIKGKIRGFVLKIPAHLQFANFAQIFQPL